MTNAGHGQDLRLWVVGALSPLVQKHSLRHSFIPLSLNFIGKALQQEDWHLGHRRPHTWVIYRRESIQYQAQGRSEQNHHIGFWDGERITLVKKLCDLYTQEEPHQKTRCRYYPSPSLYRKVSRSGDFRRIVPSGAAETAKEGDGIRWKWQMIFHTDKPASCENQLIYQRSPLPVPPAPPPLRPYPLLNLWTLPLPTV